MGLISYARKSHNKDEDNESRGNCLTRMINVLYDRPKTEVVFLSPVSSCDNDVEKFTLSPFSCSGKTQGKKKTLIEVFNNH